MNSQRVAPRVMGDRRKGAPFLDSFKPTVLFEVFEKQTPKGDYPCKRIFRGIACERKWREETRRTIRQPHSFNSCEGEKEERRVAWMSLRLQNSHKRVHQDQ